MNKQEQFEDFDTATQEAISEELYHKELELRYGESLAWGRF